jgi:hypothetical protein
MRNCSMHIKYRSKLAQLVLELLHGKATHITGYYYTVVVMCVIVACYQISMTFCLRYAVTCSLKRTVVWYYEES